MGRIYQISSSTNLIVGISISVQPAVQIALKNARGFEIVFEENAWSDFLCNEIILKYATLKNQINPVDEVLLHDSNIRIEFVDIGEQPALRIVKGKISVTIFTTTYINILFVSHAVNMIYERCKNHVQEIKNKLYEFLEVVDSNDTKLIAYNKILACDKFQQNILDYEVLGSSIGFLLNYKKSLLKLS